MFSTMVTYGKQQQQNKLQFLNAMIFFDVSLIFHHDVNENHGTYIRW